MDMDNVKLNLPNAEQRLRMLESECSRQQPRMQWALLGLTLAGILLGLGMGWLVEHHHFPAPMSMGTQWIRSPKR